MAASAVEPTPAELPLAPGKTDATVRVHPLRTGTAAWPEAWAHRVEGPLGPVRAFGLGSKTVPIPLPSFLVEHPSAGPLMIDSGIDPATMDDRAAEYGRVLGAFMARSFRIDQEHAAAEQVRARGVDPAAVKLVLMTHLHLDHTGGLKRFPNATVVMSGSESRSFDGSRPFARGYVPSHLPAGARRRLLDFDGPQASAHSSFTRALDLFGDGSVRALFTPGHTHGHVSYLLRTDSGDLLLAGDACYTRHALATGHLPYLMQDADLFKRSLAEIRAHAQASPETIVIPGHDMEAWNELAESY